MYFGSSDGNVYALEAATGAVKWKFKTGDVVLSSPALADGTLFIGSWDTYLYALDATSGAEKWRFETGEGHEIYNQVGIQGSPAVADGIVIFWLPDSNFYALAAASGKTALGLQQQGFMGHQFASHSRRQSILRDVGHGTGSRAERKVRRGYFHG